MIFRDLHKSKHAFTLAEVLITLGIIGLVAALSIPQLTQSYKQKTASMKIKKFYSNISQAIKMAEIEHESCKNWEYKSSNIMPDTETGTYGDGDKELTEEFFNKYLAKHLVYLKTEISEENLFRVVLNDGSTLKFRAGHCMDLRFDYNGNSKPNENGRDIYWFLICPENTPYKAGFGTYYLNYSAQNRSDIVSGCRSYKPYCSRLLEMDGWEFKSDYPIKL